MRFVFVYNLIKLQCSKFRYEKQQTKYKSKLFPISFIHHKLLAIIIIITILLLFINKYVNSLNHFDTWIWPRAMYCQIFLYSSCEMLFFVRCIALSLLLLRLACFLAYCFSRFVCFSVHTCKRLKILAVKNRTNCVYDSWEKRWLSGRPSGRTKQISNLVSLFCVFFASFSLLCVGFVDRKW